MRNEGSLRDNLNDRAWLERTAREHEEVLQRALARSAVIPFRLCTIYESRDRVREFLATRGAALVRVCRVRQGLLSPARRRGQCEGYGPVPGSARLPPQCGPTNGT